MVNILFTEFLKSEALHKIFSKKFAHQKISFYIWPTVQPKINMPRTKQQVEAIRQQRVIQILDAALDVFAHKGFHSATIADIAQKAGVAKGLLYHYYNSKEEPALPHRDYRHEQPGWEIWRESWRGSYRYRDGTVYQRHVP